GWGQQRRIFDPLLPSFGPQLAAPMEHWKPTPSIPESQKASFDFKLPEQGQNVRLHRLGPPAGVEVGFRSRKVSWCLEGLAFLAVFLVGIRCLGAPLSQKITLAAVLGGGALVATGLLSAANGAIAQAAMLGVLASVTLWLAFLLPMLWRALTGLRLGTRIFLLALLGEFMLLALAIASRAHGLAEMLLCLTFLTTVAWILTATVAMVRARVKPAPKPTAPLMVPMPTPEPPKAEAEVK
ncbi:MAG: hypothetical protein ACOYMN_00330, partial [Roseimicrobium sp.]